MSPSSFLTGIFAHLCAMEKKLKTIGKEIENSMAIMKQIQMTAEEAGLKSD